MYGVPVDKTQIRRSILQALGDGGTVEMADGVLAYLSPLLEDDARTLEADPFADDAPKIVLAGLAEVAALSSTPKQTIGHWLAGRRVAPVNFPHPRWELATGPVWDMADIRSWLGPGDEPTNP